MDAATQLASDFAKLPDILRAHAVERGGKTAIVGEDGALTYAALDAAMDRIAAALQRDGLARGQAVAIVGAPSVAYAAVFLGTLRAGGAATPLAPGSTPEQLSSMIADCGAAHVFVDAGARAALAGQPISARIIELGSAAFDAWLAPEGARPTPVEIAPSDPFNIIYSSGTTGAPKGIVQSHAMRSAHISRAGVFGYDGEAVTLISTPLYSNTTLVSLLPALAGGGAVVLMEKFDALGFLQTAARVRASHAMLVPVQYRRLLEHPQFDTFDLTSFRMKFCTSAPFAAALKAEVLRRWPGGLIEYFGMTEGGGTCILLAHHYREKLHTVGQPAPGHDIRLIDEDGVEVPQGETGEIVGRSDAMMLGYRNQPGLTAKAIWRSPQGQDFIRTGDMGRFDAEGFLTLMDRKKDMIISGGFNIYPSDLETVLLLHPAIAEAAVIGAASHQWGETPVAFVSLKPRAQEEAEAIRAFANGQLGKVQRIAQVIILDALPRSPIGKVLKRELRDSLAGKEELA